MALENEAWEQGLTIFDSLYYVGASEKLIGVGNWRSTFQSTIAYNKNDLVKDDLGQVYVCLAGTSGPSGPTNIPVTNQSKWDRISYNDTLFKWHQITIDGSNVTSTGYPNGRQQFVTIPSGLLASGDVVVVEAWLTRISGGSTAWSLFVDNQQVTETMAVNGNNPCRIRGTIIKYGNNGSGSPADLVGYLDHPNSGASGLRRGSIAIRNTSGQVEISLVKTSSGVWRCEFFSVYVYKSTSSS